MKTKSKKKVVKKQQVIKPVVKKQQEPELKGTGGYLNEHKKDNCDVVGCDKNKVGTSTVGYIGVKFVVHVCAEHQGKLAGVVE